MTTDPRQSSRCWSTAEVGTGLTPHLIPCTRGRHRWGKHRNRAVRWACPPYCGCIRHPGPRRVIPTA
ncbi:hypothetical protein ABZX72_29420 [Streptomyces cyaneofuscatus]|uniref:hypothetical protein n=1 Tax=Streptomyces cyaneofuscatus TaxID=66883 RepID=UPI0033A17B2B